MARKKRTHTALPPEQRVKFPDLLRVHFRWRQSLLEGSTATAEERAELDREYHEARWRFEHEHGEIVSA